MSQGAASGSGEIEHLCNEILRYLKYNPNARDTLEGIVEWWLLEGEIKRETDKISRALKRLVASRQLEANHGSDGRTHYMIPRQRHRKTPVGPTADEDRKR